MYQGPVAIQTIAPGLFLCAWVGKFSAATQFAQRVGQGAIAGLAGGGAEKRSVSDWVCRSVWPQNIRTGRPAAQRTLIALEPPAIP